MTQQIERSSTLDSLGRKIGLAFANIVRPGRLKDFLAGTWLGHPAHPMLTDVPIGAWTSALALDLLAGDEARRASSTLVGVGVLTALPTAITGLSDLSDIVDNEERSVGTAHALGNVLAVALYGASYLARREGKWRAGRATAVLGAAAMTAAGFLGGHLSYRKGLGVDHTAFESRIEEWTAVLDDHALPEGKATRVTCGSAEVLLCRVEGNLRGLANRCSHRGGPLHKGRIAQGQVTCPWHLSTFNLEDGSIARGPATAPQRAYDVRVMDGKIEIRAHP